MKTKIQKISFIILLFLSITVFPQTVSISGKVTTSYLFPVKNAIVELANIKLSDTTDSLGKFQISGTSNIIFPLKNKVESFVFLNKNLLNIHINKKENLFIRIFNCKGELIKQIFNGPVNPGSYSFKIYEDNKSYGVNIIQIKIGLEDFIFSLLQQKQLLKISNNNFSHNNKLSFEKSSAVTDTIKVTAKRYYSLSQPIDSYTKTNLNLVINSLIDTGIGAGFNGIRPFPDDNPWNTPIDKDSIDPNSDRIIAGIGADIGLHADFGANWNGGPFGIPYIVVTSQTPKVNVSFDYADESDPGPYPIPPNAPIEGGPNSTGDRHVIVIDRDNWILYELFAAYPQGDSWHAGSGAIFNLESNALRPAGWTSADAAGLPIFPGLVRYDEVCEQKEIKHALRFTVVNTRRAYIPPATHYASNKTADTLPPMGMRVRLKANVDISGFPQNVQVILKALKIYGMIVADNGSNWYISGAPDSRWNDSELNTLKNIKGRDFEVIKMRDIVTK